MQTKEIRKEKFLRQLKVQLGDIANIRQVRDVINILLEEIIKDFKEDKKIKIKNLGVLYFQKMKPRHYHNLFLNKTMYSEGGYIIKFFIAEKIKRKMLENLDLDKTFPDDQLVS